MKFVKGHNRNETIGGSDVAPVLGLSPWRSPLDVYLEKVGEAEPQEETPAMYWGKVLEDVVAKHFAETEGVAVSRMNMTVVDGCLSANVDRLAHQSGKRAYYKGEIRTDTLVEIKTSRSDNGWGEPGTGEIPIYYMTQVQHYLGLTGCKTCYVPVLFQGRDYRLYVVERDDELVARLQQKLREWWRHHVLEKVPPAPRTEDDLKKIFPVSTNVAKVASREVEEAVREMARLKAVSDELEADMKRLREQVILELADAEELQTPAGESLVTYKSSKPRRTVAWKDIAEELLPEDEGKRQEVITRHTSEADGVRRFLLKVKEAKDA